MTKTWNMRTGITLPEMHIIVMSDQIKQVIRAILGYALPGHQTTEHLLHIEITKRSEHDVRSPVCNIYQSDKDILTLAMSRPPKSEFRVLVVQLQDPNIAQKIRQFVTEY